MIKSRTNKRAAEERQYRKEVAEWIKGRCCFGCQYGFGGGIRIKAATECHHSRGRIGKLLLDKRYWVPLCRDCHDLAHREIAKAREFGIICMKGKWNTAD